MYVLFSTFFSAAAQFFIAWVAGNGKILMPIPARTYPIAILIATCAPQNNRGDSIEKRGALVPISS